MAKPKFRQSGAAAQPSDQLPACGAAPPAPPAGVPPVLERAISLLPAVHSVAVFLTGVCTGQHAGSVHAGAQPVAHRVAGRPGPRGRSFSGATFFHARHAAYVTLTLLCAR